MLAVAILFLTVLSGCETPPLYQQDLKTFRAKGMSISLPEEFEQSELMGFDAAFDSPDVAVFVIKELFSEADWADYTLQQYAELILQGNEEKNPSPITQTEGLTVFEHSSYNQLEQCTFQYLSVMFKGTDAFWLFQFTCDQTNYQQYKPHFIKWAKTVSFS